MEIFSFSRLNLFDTCHRRFAYKYVERLADPPGLPAVLGKTIHKANELCLNGHPFEDAIITAYLEEGDSTVDRMTVESMVKTALNYGYSGPTEQHFLLQLTKNIRVQGYIDLQADNTSIPTIVDWKSGFNCYGVFDTWQLPLYAAAVMEQSGFKSIKGVYAFLRFKRTESALITQKEASQAKQWVIQTAQEIQSRLELLAVLEIPEAFPSRSSPACGNCPWSLSCLREEKRLINF